MSIWDIDISAKARKNMKFLGNFGPTVHEHLRELKGYMSDEDGGGKVYLDSHDLRELADSCVEVADWLDKRADAIANDEELP